MRHRIRIPAENLDAFLAQLGDTINIVDNQSTVDDVSSKYYDIVSRLETLEAERTALTNMYASADTVEYMLQIQKRLYDVIEEIESYKTTLKYYDNQVAYSTVNLLIEEVIEYTEKVPEPATFGERISRAFRRAERVCRSLQELRCGICLRPAHSSCAGSTGRRRFADCISEHA